MGNENWNKIIWTWGFEILRRLSANLGEFNTGNSKNPILFLGPILNLIQYLRHNLNIIWSMLHVYSWCSNRRYGIFLGISLRQTSASWIVKEAVFEFISFKELLRKCSVSPRRHCLSGDWRRLNIICWILYKMQITR